MGSRDSRKNQIVSRTQEKKAAISTMMSYSERKCEDKHSSMRQMQHNVDKNEVASLYLPSMPSESSLSSPPTIRLLVCADIDIRSSAALCEFILQQRNELFDSMSIDMVLVAGPLTSESDVGSFGINRRPSSEHEQQRHRPDYPLYALPYMETQEKSASRLGMITACISQLENIVCRVLYLMGASDPLLRQQQRRLTPNSRHLNQQWLGIAPGLGCAGLDYIDDLEGLLRELKENQNDLDEEKVGDSPSPHNWSTLNNSSDLNSRSAILSQRIADMAERKQKYEEIIEQLLTLSEHQHQPPHPYLQKQTVSTHRSPQTILVTQHVRKQSNVSEQLHRKDCNGKTAAAKCADDARVCFEVASSLGPRADGGLQEEEEVARWIEPRRLYPGSLRTRGEFVLVDVSLQKSDGGLLRWETTNSQFFALNNFHRNDNDDSTS